MAFTKSLFTAQLPGYKSCFEQVSLKCVPAAMNRRHARHVAPMARTSSSSVVLTYLKTRPKLMGEKTTIYIYIYNTKNGSQHRGSTRYLHVGLGLR